MMRIECKYIKQTNNLWGSAKLLSSTTVAKSISLTLIVGVPIASDSLYQTKWMIQRRDGWMIDLRI